MGFSDRQLRALGRSVPSRNIKTRVSAGKELTYIEGWYALSQANRIFGFDGWDRETVETKCLQQRESRGHCSAVYSARVRITVRTNDTVIIRDGHGTGEAHGDYAGEVHDRALKAAETDATKRALATFGKAFGLALYAGVGRTNESRALAKGQQPGSEVVTKQIDQPEQERSSRPPVNGSANGSGSFATDVAERSTPVDSAAEPGLPNSPVTTENGQQVPVRIDKSALPLSEPRRLRDKEHLRFVASQPCLLCSTAPCDAHHLRFSQPRALGRKVGDDFTVPLCRQHHRDLHDSGNEAAWWHDMGIDALEIAKDLWDESLRGQLGSAGSQC